MISFNQNMQRCDIFYILMTYLIAFKSFYRETDGMRIADSWILSEIIRFLICMAVFFAVTFLLDAVFPNKKESH